MRLTTLQCTPYGPTDSEFQSHFDENCKLPRLDDDCFDKCYSCDRFIRVANKIVTDGLEIKSE